MTDAVDVVRPQNKTFFPVTSGKCFPPFSEKPHTRHHGLLTGVVAARPAVLQLALCSGDSFLKRSRHSRHLARVGGFSQDSSPARRTVSISPAKAQTHAQSR